MQSNFEKYLTMLRSANSAEYEEGYHTLLRHIHLLRDRLVELMKAENEPRLRSRYIELLGDTSDVTLVDLLSEELQHESDDVKYWALMALEQIGSEKAMEVATKFRKSNTKWN